jgi:nitroreductase
MARAFSPAPLDPDLVDRLAADALRAPSAGNSQGAELVVLAGPEQTSR